MTTVKHNEQAQDTKQEVRDLQRTAKKVASSKESAKEFLISTGMYTSSGELKPEYS